MDHIICFLDDDQPQTEVIGKETVKQVGPRLHELSPATRGSQARRDAVSSNLGPTFLPSLYLFSPGVGRQHPTSYIRPILWCAITIKVLTNFFWKFQLIGN